MIIELLTVGKIKENYLNDAIDEYTKRLSKYATIKQTEVKETKLPKSASDKDIDRVIETESERLFNKIKNDAYVVALAIEGKQFSSERFARHLEEVMTYESHHFVFLIGGSHGLSERLKRRANLLWSFSKLTFPHQLMRVIVLEQVYRAMKINHNEPYHK